MRHSASTFSYQPIYCFFCKILFSFEDMEQMDQVLCCDDRDRVCRPCAKRIYDKWVATQIIQPYQQCRICGNCFDTLNVVTLWSKYILNLTTHRRNEEYIRRNSQLQHKHPAMDRSGYMGTCQEPNVWDEHNGSPIPYPRTTTFNRMDTDRFERSNSAIRGHPNRGLVNNMNYPQTPSVGQRQQQFNPQNPEDRNQSNNKGYFNEMGALTNQFQSTSLLSNENHSMAVEKNMHQSSFESSRQVQLNSHMTGHQNSIYQGQRRQEEISRTNFMENLVEPSNHRRHQVDQLRPKSANIAAKPSEGGYGRVYEVDDYSEHSFGERKE